ncbi:hypothetical protein IP84_04185 [beta proteobacterium AAP99]|nr:hypothetical protein IP84_04185 [beta proteobacterium AAP99]
MRAAVLTLSLSLALAACGGGGGAGSTPPPPPPSPPTGSGICSQGGAFAVSSDASVDVGKTATAMVAGCAGAITNPVWTQTGGPAVTLLSAKSQAISFDAATAGTYSFAVSFRDATGATQNVPVSITAAAPASPALLTIRGEPSVFGGGSTSLRAWPRVPANVSISSVRWEQTEGPAVTLNTEDPQRIIFAAPVFNQDLRLSFRATITLSNGATDSDTQTLLVQALPAPPANQLFRGQGYPLSSRVYAYRPASRWAPVLASCVYSPTISWASSANNNLCTMTTLPLLAQETNGALPSVAQVMDRVLVSNDWMGEVFERFLTEQDTSGDLRRMLMATTAIVLGGRVRPSFYAPLTGAIYLDAGNLWLTPDQRDTVSEVPDARSSFAQNLQYRGLWRYTRNNQRFPTFVAANQRQGRPTSELPFTLGWLLYHELTHANDFIRPAIQLTVNRTSKVADITDGERLAGRLPSDNLTAIFPLRSAELRGLAQSKFGTGDTSATQNAYTPSQVAALFSADLATDEYNFYTTREDIAMTVEEFFVQRRFAGRRDVAITNRPACLDTPVGCTSNDYIVTWGQRGRVGEASIRPRLNQALGDVAPWLGDIAGATATLPAPIAMRPGESWAQNLNLETPSPGLPAQFKISFDTLLQDELAMREQLRQLEDRKAGHRAMAWRGDTGPGR